MNVKDLAASEKFYCRMLGMEKRFRFLKKGEEIGFYADAGNATFIEFFQSESTTPGKEQLSPFKHLCLQVDDIEKIRTQLEEYGVNLGEKKLGADGSFQAWTADPDGVPIELHEYTSESSQRTGRDVCLDAD